jgi:hypothetical protein
VKSRKYEGVGKNGRVRHEGRKNEERRRGNNHRELVCNVDG